MLAEAQENYKKERKFKFSTPAKFKPEKKFLNEIDSMALCNAQLNLGLAFSDYIKDKKDPTKTRKHGFPKFKCRKTARKAYTTNCITDRNNIRIVGDCLRLPKLGLVKAVFHRRVEGKIKSVTVSQTGSGVYYASIAVELPDLPKIKPDLTKVIGLDFSFACLFVANEGTKTKYIRWFKQAEDKLARAQRRLSHKVYGSRGYEKQLIKVARIHESIANKRLDCLYKLAKEILDKYDVFVVEDIDLVAMAKRGKRRRFGKTIMDLGFGLFRDILKRKAEEVGKLFFKAPRFFASTQLCSACGYKNTDLKGLDNADIRSWTCPQCGTFHDRDVNAAQNLVNWFRTELNTGALPGINAEGDVVPTSEPVRSKRRRGFRKKCKTVDLACPSIIGGVS
jgi:putative transposase